MLSKKTGSHFRNFLIGIVVVLFAMWCFFPLLWMIICSFKTAAQMYVLPPKFLFKPTFSNYIEMFVERNMLQYFINSIISAGISTVIAVMLGALAGYALARGRIPRKQDIAFWIITTRMAPISVVILPFFLIFRFLRIIYTPYALILAYISFNLPFATWLLKGFFEELPREIEEAALCDGSGKMGVLLRISLPLAMPGLVVATVLCFMFAWNDYMFALVLTSRDTMTLPVVASRYLAAHRAVPWEQVTSAASFVFAPVLIAGLLVRRYLVRGLTFGALK